MVPRAAPICVVGRQADVGRARVCSWGEGRGGRACAAECLGVGGVFGSGLSWIVDDASFGAVTSVVPGVVDLATVSVASSATCLLFLSLRGMIAGCYCSATFCRLRRQHGVDSDPVRTASRWMS